MLYVNPLDMAMHRYADPNERTQQREEVALQEFERLFLYQLLSEMRRTVPSGGLLPETPQRRFMNEMLDDAMAGAIAASGQFGIAKQIAHQIHHAESGEKSGQPSLKPRPVSADMYGDVAQHVTFKEYRV